MSSESYLFVSRTEFQESSGLVSATFMELDKVSENKRLYRFENAQEIIDSLIGSAVRFGVDLFGRHLTKGSIVGIVESAQLVGKKIVGTIRITTQSILDKLKKGIKFLLSVGGIGFPTFKKGYTIIENPEIQHVQMWESNQKNLLGQPQSAGFNSAKIEKILEIQESVLFCGSRNKFIALLTSLEVI